MFSRETYKQLWNADVYNNALHDLHDFLVDRMSCYMKETTFVRYLQGRLPYDWYTQIYKDDNNK